MERENSTYHVPALLPEAISLLDIKPDGVYVDATFGGGGHSRGILQSLGEDGRLYGFDRDMEAYANRIEDSRFIFVHSNFRYIRNFMRFYGVDKVDGILADLGVSFHHFDSAERGFSFRNDAPLDMRMNRGSSKTAAEIVTQASEEDLNRIFREYTDIKRTREIARAIVFARESNNLSTTEGLATAITPVLDPQKLKKELAQVFQALRIEVNHEMEDLTLLLKESLEILKPGGRLAVLTYHSVEDRMVKNFMKTGNIEGEQEKDFFGNVSSPWKLITRKPIEPDKEEIERNPRSRSAKLRVAELKNNP